MATGFSRSVSLPNSNLPSCSSRSEKSFHVRSTSLPCRSHPVVSQIEDELRACCAWRSTEPRSAAGLCSGMSRLELLHLSLGDLLQLPQTRDALRRSTGGPSGLSESLLEDFLLFADAYGSFRSALVSLQEVQLSAQVAVRRRDETCLASVARSLRKAEKEIASLSSALSNASSKKSSEPTSLAAASSKRSAEDAELVGILREVKAVTVSVSSAIFRVTAASVASTMTAVASNSSASWTITLKRRLALTPSSSKKKKGSWEVEKEEAWARTASEKLDGMEEGIIGLESASERVFRALMNTRVSLLNIMTP